MRTDYGQKWLNFYINFRFPVGIAIDTFFLLAYLIGFSSSIGFSNGSISLMPKHQVFIAFLIVGFGILALRVFVYTNMKNRTYQGYYMNVILLIAEVAYIPVFYAVYTPTWKYLILLPINVLIWGWPNYIYFKHRKYLFDGSSQNTLQEPPSTKNISVIPAQINNSLSINTHSAAQKTLTDGNDQSTSANAFVDKNAHIVRIKSVLTDNIKSLSPILRRAFLLIEDGEWEKADGYIERVLDAEPENSFAYLAKLMIESQSTSLETVVGRFSELKESKNYIKFLRFASEQIADTIKTDN